MDGRRKNFVLAYQCAGAARREDVERRWRKAAEVVVFSAVWAVAAAAVAALAGAVLLWGVLVANAA